MNEKKKQEILAKLNKRTDNDCVEMGLDSGQAFCIHYDIPTRGRH